MDYRLPEQIDPGETLWDQWGPIKRLRRKLMGAVYRISDSGLFGLTPLRTHVLICGYPRSGTTLLLMMMEYAYPEARRFRTEKSAWRAATFEWRNHAVMISKVPNDIFRLHQMRNFYRGRRASLKCIAMVRDPRDVLTSFHQETGKDVYFQDIAEWHANHACLWANRHEPDVMVLRYEDLVADPDAVQAKIDSFTGELSHRPYTDAHKQGPADFYTAPLNGVRPVDKKGIGRWRRPQHRVRMEEIINQLPDFDQILVDLGYESDAGWIMQWRRELQAAAPSPPVSHANQ